MKEGTKLINKQSKKKATYIKEDKTHTWIKICDIETPIPTNIFKRVYEEDNESS